ncbi:MAG: polyprenyl diphosphate synthase [Phycisphaerales bacterium]
MPTTTPPTPAPLSAPCPALAAVLARNPRARPHELLPDVPVDRIPRHVAIIMDGNGRWAERRGFQRVFGQRNGARAVREAIEECLQLGIEVLTLYSFSLENWKRPAEEVQALMSLYLDYLTGEAEHMARESIRFVQVGRRDGLPPEALAICDKVSALTAGNRALTLCLAVNYGSRAELTDAVRAIAQRVKRGEIAPGDVDEALIEDHLCTRGLPDPDLLIRTAGEMRVSNFLLWQISYAELYVTPTLWPDFGRDELHKAVRDFAARDRRFGGLGTAARK